MDRCESYLGHVDRLAPGLVAGLYLHGSLCWGEFYSGSDVDFVAVLARRPDSDDIDTLARVQREIVSIPGPAFDGFHCIADDLARAPASCPPVPVFFAGRFDEAGHSDVNPVTWHELAERGIVIRGSDEQLAHIHTDLPHLRAFTHDNLDTYWRRISAELDGAGNEAIGGDPDAIVWTVLGMARLHHLLATGRLTSKSGAGRYIIDGLAESWRRIAQEALRLRERPTESSRYASPAARGRDTRAFVAWAIGDGLAQQHG